jgi:hypothetical protein
MPDTRKRLLTCIGLAMLAGLFNYYKFNDLIEGHSDFGQVWFAARALLRGENPYEVIGRLRAFHWPWPFYYPLPAAIVAIPFVGFAERMASALFVFVGAGAFAWALTRESYVPLLAFLTPCVWQAFQLAQWSPLLAAAFVVAPLSVVLTAKPTIGAAVFAARPSRLAIRSGVALTLIAFALQPSWISDWLAALQHGRVQPGKEFHSLIPVMLPGGVLLMGALTRWRRPEARLLAAMAFVPQTLLQYEAVPLFLIPHGRNEVVALVVLSHAFQVAIEWLLPYNGFADAVNSAGRLMVAFLYLPALAMVLRRRNEGQVPAWIERLTVGLPAWLRGAGACQN